MFCSGPTVYETSINELKTAVIMRNKPRSRSAPPFSTHDFGVGWELREDGHELEDLQMDSADLAEFSTIEIFIDYHPRSMYWVDNDKVLKLFSYLIDVSVIVANMDLARTRIPVPRVLRYGQSGNCSYILMERIPYPNLEVEMQQLGIKSMPWGLTRAIDYIVRELANLGLSHNDLVPRNVLVDNNGMIVSIIDWDPSTQHHRGGEYARKIRELSYFKDVAEEDWYHIFLRYAPDRTGEEIMIGCSKWHSKLGLQWPLVKRKASQLVSSPGLDPRNQSFSRQKIHPITVEPVDATFHPTHIRDSAFPNISIV
ncbi:kinase-like domain-containing protein [Lentinula edodes]|nr:kinase-like domain-containing protein [Lentinula edodes]